MRLSICLLLVLSGASERRGASDQRALTLPDTVPPNLGLAFESGIGGSGFVDSFLHPYFQSDYGTGIALDGAGNIYLTGIAWSKDFPLVKALPLAQICSATTCACPSAFVAKLTPDAKTVLYSTLLAACSQSPPSIAVDSSGNAYVAGAAIGSQPLVQVNGGTAIANGESDTFVAKLDTNGVLKGATLFGGAAADAATSIVLGRDGSLYVTGTTSSMDFPVSASALRNTLSSREDIFLMKLDPSLGVLYSTFLGPGTTPVVAADAAGNAYVAAITTSMAWPTTQGVIQPSCSGRILCSDAIAVKVNAAGTQLVYATYLGGSGSESVGGIAVDAAGSAYLTGSTDSSDFPTTPGAFVPQLNPGTSRTARTAFAVKLSPDASRLSYSTLLTAEDGLAGTAIALDGAGDAWIGGFSSSFEPATLPGFQSGEFNMICGNYTPSGSIPLTEGYCPQAGYLAELNPAGTTMLYGTYLGGGNVSAGAVPDTPPATPVNAITIGGDGGVLVTGNQLAMRSTVAAPSVTNSASVIKIASGGTAFSAVAVQSAAGFGNGLPLPGGLAALYLSGAPLVMTTVAPGLPLPTQLAGITVLVDGIPAPIVAVAALPNGSNRAQVNFQVPWEIVNTPFPRPHIVAAQFGGQSSFLAAVQAAPGIFTLPDGSGAIQHAADYSLVTVQNPVKHGETLIIYATGLGAVNTPVPSGVGSSGADPVATSCNHVVTNAGTILYAGLTPGFPGLYQVNVQVSQYLPPGVNYFYLQASACWLPAPPAPSYQSNSVGVYLP